MVDALIRPTRPQTYCRLTAFIAPLAASALLAGSAQAAAPVPMGTAGSFAVLAGSTITNSGPSTISGDIGLCCSGVATTGFGAVTQPRGTLYTGTGGVAAGAQADLDVAYADAASQAITRTVPVDLSLSGTPATPLLPGVYESTSHGAFAINNGLTLDFAGDPNAVFIFQGTQVTTAAAAAGSIQIVNGGATPSTCNIYWQLSDATQGVTLGADSAFKGTTMALGASALGTGATVEGRILTRRSKAVTLLANTITQTSCATTTPPPTTPPPTTPPPTTPPPTTPPPTTPPPTTTPTPTPTVTTVPTQTATTLPTPSTPAPVSATPKPSTTAAPVGMPLPGRAQLSGPTAPVSGPFVVFVTGRDIAMVVFYVDGRRVGTVRAKAGRVKFKQKINPRGQDRGVHRVTARVTFRTPGRRTTTLRMIYRRPPASARPPQFTG